MPLTVTQKNQPSIEREPLRWLFKAYFADGSSLVQDENDTCTTRTDGTGSAFTDVLAREDELIAFELVHVNNREAVLVDLNTGAFSVNGTPLHAHNQYFEPQAKDKDGNRKYKLKLVYFRENRVDTDVRGVVQADGSVASEEIDKRHYTNRYFLGWSTIVNGVNKQVTLAVG